MYNNTKKQNDKCENIITLGFFGQDKARADKTYNLDKNKKLTLRAFNNHKISFQAMIKTSENLDNVRVFVKQRGEEKKFNIDNIKIYWADYLTTSKSSSPFFEKGKYFDALIDERVKEKTRLNNITKDENQLFLFQINICDACVGLYSFEICFSNNLIDEKLFFDIFIDDIKLDAQIACKNLFGIMKEDIPTNSDFLQEIRKINTLLNEHGVSSNKLNIVSFLDFESYLRQLIYAHNCKNISAFIIEPIDNAGNIDFLELQERLEKIIDYSILNKINLLEKAYMYITSIDEPTKNDYEKVQAISKKISNIKNYLLQKNYFGETKIYNSVKNLQNIFTVFFDGELYDYVKIWCPTFSCYHMPELRYIADMRRKKGDRMWFYGCVWPLNPFPNYHLEDDLLSSRIVGFMQAYYGIEGNLYWSVNLSRAYNLETKEYSSCNIYENPMLFPPVNGDGYLIYNGEKYNENCYFPSIRLDSIKNGIYDYQILDLLKKNLERLNILYGTDILLHEYIWSISNKLFYGTIIKRDEIDYNFAMSLIMDLVCLAVRHDILIVSDCENIIVYNGKKTIVNFCAQEKSFILDDIKICQADNFLNISINNFEYAYLLEKASKTLPICNYNGYKINVEKNSIAKVSIKPFSNDEKIFMEFDFCEFRLTSSNTIIVDTSYELDSPLIVQLLLTDINNNTMIIDYGIIDRQNTKIRFNLYPLFSTTFSDFETTAISNSYDERKKKSEQFSLAQIKKWGLMFKNFQTYNIPEKTNEECYEFIIKNVQIM